MSVKKFKKIAIKIGSNVITDEQGNLHFQRIENITRQIARLKQNGVDIVLISSGAVAAGKKYVNQQVKKYDEVSFRQVSAAIGQIKLQNIYNQLFETYHITCAQVLLTKEDFRDRRHFYNIKNCLVQLQESHVIPIVNENDVVSVSELMFTDNDELAGLVASLMGCDALFILSNIDGIFTAPPDNLGAKLISEIDPNLPLNIHHFISSQKSNFGRGGMITKYHIALQAAKEGITVYITNGEKEDVLLKLIEDDTKVKNTKFLPATNKTKKSEKQQWLAIAQKFYAADIYINNGAKKALFSNKASSLLLVGIHKIKGTFKKDDIVRLLDMNDNIIGVGKTQYDSDIAKEHLGEHNFKPLIHYDYLHIY